MLKEIPIVDLAPSSARSFSVALNKQVPRRREVRTDCGVADRRLMVGLKRLSEELLLVLEGCIHAAGF